MLTVHDLETPSVLIDLEIVENNISRMQAHCNALGVVFRPHIKTHKSTALARMQRDAGAIGIACQKVSEAEVFARAGFNDIQIPYNVIGEKKTGRLADLALYNKITVSADHPDVLDGLAAAARDREISFRVLVDLATDLRRTGAPAAAVVDLAKRIEDDANLHFAGLLVYPSNSNMRPTVQVALEMLHAAGIGVDVVSGGGTAAAWRASELPELTELRVGTYIFNDWTHVLNGSATLQDCAMRIAATVVSRPESQRAILDAGSKTLSSDRINEQFGYILEYPEARIYNLNEEHAFVDLSACDQKPRIGERVHIIPVHTCVVSNLHDRLYAVRGESDLVELILPVSARGMVW